MKLPDQKKIASSLSGFVEKAFVLVLIGYIGISVGRSVMKNYEVNKRIDFLKVHIDELEQEKLYLKNLIAYYQTNTFKELKAREELGWQKPGEFVISVPVDPEDKPMDEKSNFIAMQEEEARTLTNYEKWYHYFFGS